MTSREEALRALENEIRDDAEDRHRVASKFPPDTMSRILGEFGASLLTSMADRLKDILATASEQAPVMYGPDSAKDWYLDPATQSICVDIDFDHSRQLALMLKQDGTVAWPLFVQEPDSSTVKATGPSVMNLGFFDALPHLFSSPAHTSEARDADLIEAIRVAFKAMNRSYHEDRRVMFHELQPMFDISCKYQFRLVPIEEDAAMRQEAE